MADVDTSPQEPETLGTVGKEEPAEGTHISQKEEDTKTDSDKNMSEQKRDSPEGVKENGGSLPEARTSPEGANEVAPSDSKGDNLATTNDNSNSGGATADPPTEERPSGVGEEAAPKEEESHKNEPLAKETVAEKTKEGEGEMQAQKNENPKDGRGGERGAADDDDDDEEEEEDRDGRAAEGGRGGEAELKAQQQELPPTPTFDSDHEHDEDDTIRTQAADTLEKEAASADAAEMADQTPAIVSARSPTAGLLPKRLTNTPLEGAGPSLNPKTAQLPPVARGQVRGQQMTTSISDAIKYGTQPSPKQLIRSRRPPKYIRLATVTVSPARTRPLPNGPSLYYEEPRRPKKVISWEEANNARPPLRIDMEGPTPCSYTPRVKPLNETNAPSYTFGGKCTPEKTGGARTSWSKSWFQSPHVWHTKVDFTRDSLWPSPNHYPKTSGIGPRQRTMPEAPSYTFGHKTAYSIIKPGADKEPSPNEYKRQNADRLVLARGPSFTHQLRREGTTLWGSNEVTPGPAAYKPNQQGTERPSFTIQGIRREKSHVLGPYCSL